MRWVGVLVAIGCGGEVSTIKTTTPLGTRERAPIEGPVGEPRLEVRVGTEVLVVASRERQCRQQIYETNRVDETHVVRPRGTELVVETLGTAMVVSLFGDDSRTETSLQHVAEYPCPVRLAELGVDLELPSGAHLTGTTDSRGLASFAIPETEPSTGTVIARAGGLISQADYDRRPKPAMAPQPSPATGNADAARQALAQARDAASACAKTRGLGQLKVTLTFVDGVQAVTDGDRGLAMCVSRAVAAIKFPAMRRGTRIDLTVRP